MIIFQNKEYELFFSNKLPPLIALNYADELFFDEFEKLCGKRYRILSIIRNGWQQKYGLKEDIEKLAAHLESKIKDENWIREIFESYDKKSKELREFLIKIKESEDPIDDLIKVREKSAILDAMSNMLHLFSSLVGYKFFDNLSKYTNDKEKLNKNFVYYTQPIRQSRFATLKEIEDKIELSDYDKTFSQILRIGAFIKDDVSELLDMRKKMMNGIFGKIADKLELNGTDLEYLRTDEIEDYFTNNKDTMALIKKRKKITILFYPEKGINVYEGDEAEEFIVDGGFKENTENKDVKEFHGQKASVGVVEGTVKVCLNSEEANNKIEEGDILVAPYTAVEYLSAMKKASAIITETGGITSHAAIVSRELGIPCVIGVKDITKILKGGQKVEVDGNEGSVKLLSH